MKILVISNFYPPYFIGGYELRCFEIVEKLKCKGYKIKILTSNYGVDNKTSKADVFRCLKSDFGWNFQKKTPFQLFCKEINNHLYFKQICKNFNPDIIYVWNLTGLSVSLIFKAQDMKFPVCFAVSDNWLARWMNDSWYSLCNRIPQRFLKKVAWKLIQPFLRILGLTVHSKSLDLKFVHFASQYTHQVCLKSDNPVSNAKVIHWGINISQFPYKNHTSFPLKKLLCVGQIIHHKGLHTLIESLRIIIQEHNRNSIRLTIVGKTISSEYEAYIQDMISCFRLEEYISFKGLIPNEELARIYSEHDVLVYPSIIDEAFSHVPLEAMASGLAVVSTVTGGNTELFTDEVNALVFPKEDAKTCASQIIRLLDDPELFENIRQNGRRTVEEKFRFETTIDKIEDVLQTAVKTYTPI